MKVETDMLVDGRTVAVAEIADTWARRLRGLLGRRELPEAFLLHPETSVHGMGMRVPLDIAVLDDAGTVLAVQVLRLYRRDYTYERALEVALKIISQIEFADESGANLRL